MLMQAEKLYRNSVAWRSMASAFGKRLAQAREHAGLTQVELAAKVPMAQSTLASAESGGDGSRLTVQIARVCGVDPYWLATGEGDMLAGAGAAAPSPHHQAPAHPRVCEG